MQRSERLKIKATVLSRNYQRSKFRGSNGGIMDSFNMCQRTALISQRKHKWVSREEKAAARWRDGSGLPRLKLLVLIMHSF